MSTTEPVDNDSQETQGWDDFWAEMQRREATRRGQTQTEVIRGVRVNVPQDLPMRFRARARESTSLDDPAFKELVAALFGVDVFDAWTAAGMGDKEFRVVIAWAMASGDGQPVTFQQAYEQVTARENAAENAEDGDDAGKAEGSTQTSGESGGSGRSSKRTSAASTASTPTESPT